MERVTKREAPEAIKVLRKRLAVYMHGEGRRKGLALKTRPDDVIFSFAHKAGTTWVKMVRTIIETVGFSCCIFCAAIPGSSVCRRLRIFGNNCVHMSVIVLVKQA